MNPSKIVTICKREMWQIIGTKGFIFMVLFPLLMLALMGGLMPLAERLMTKAKKSRTEPIEIGVISNELVLAEKWKEKLADQKLDNGLPLYELTTLMVPGLPQESIESSAKEQVRKKKLDGYVVFRGNILDQGTCEFYTLRGFNIEMLGDLRWPLTQTVREERLAHEGFDPERITHLNRGISWNEYEVSEVAKADEGKGVRKASFAKRFAPAMVSIMLMLFLTFSTSQRMSRGIVEEKTSRVIEVILSSVSPSELLFGKVLAFFLIGLLQFAAWLVIGYFALQTWDIDINEYIAPGFVGNFMIFLTTGYLFYASIFASIGAMVGDETESQQSQGLITMLIILPMMFNFVFITNPNWWPVRLISFIPFFSPTVMAIRMAVAPVVWWEIAAVGCTTAISAIIGIWLASRVFRIGILMTGKRPSLKELWKWCMYREYYDSVKS